jgi:hypothetical protein
VLNSSTKTVVDRVPDSASRDEIDQGIDPRLVYKSQERRGPGGGGKALQAANVKFIDEACGGPGGDCPRRSFR